MNAKKISKIIVLTSLFGLGGCAGTEQLQSEYRSQQPILSATEAQSMIQVSVRVLPPPVEQETMVAKND